MSEERRAKIVEFTDLVAWKEAHDLYVSIHLISKKFPRDEQYGLTDQIRRAALSVTSNISEGFGRNSDNDTTHYYYMARGSLYEVINQLIAARDIKILADKEFIVLYEKAQMTKRILIGLIKSTKNRKFA